VTAFRRFDVRPLLERGVEPLPEILARIGRLKEREGLVIVAPFLPSPLIEKLQSEGYMSRVEHGLGGEWMVYFWRESD